MSRKRKTKERKFVDKNVYELAIERTEKLFDMYDHIAVMFSGGKDSTATLMVALEVAEKKGRLPLDVVFYDEEAITYETEEYARRVAQDPRINLRWMCIPVQHRNACSRKQPYWYTWDPEDQDLWVRDLPPEAITELKGFKKGYTIPNCAGLLYPESEGYGTVCLLFGIRAQESLNRLRMVTKRRVDNYITEWAGDAPEDPDFPKVNNLWKAYPIYDWNVDDVWTAPKLFGWDYNRTYDILDKAGISPSLQRCSPPYGEEPLQKLWSYKVCFPDIWDKMSRRVHGANTAIRYALTELYGYGSRPEKPADVTWEEYIRKLIQRHGPKEQVLIAKRIQSEIKMHFNKTKDPILHKAPHPLTGVTWDFLVTIAMRGDFKGRKQAGAKVNIGVKPLDQWWIEYNEAREREIGGNDDEESTESEDQKDRPRKSTFSKY